MRAAAGTASAGQRGYTLATGDVFAGYAIERRLGRGGTGSVHLARHPRLPRQLALELLNPELFADTEIRARFEREADLAAQLEHPNIVTVYDRGVDDGQLTGAHLDHRSDQCSRYSLLTGVAPVEATTPVVVIQGHLQSPPPSLRAHPRPMSSLASGRRRRTTVRRRPAPGPMTGGSGPTGVGTSDPRSSRRSPNLLVRAGYCCSTVAPTTHPSPATRWRRTCRP